MPDSALLYYLKADKLTPDDPWINFAIGQIYCYQKNDIIKGLPYYHKSIVSGGGSEREINQNIAATFGSIDYYPKAEKYLKNAILVIPECAFIKEYGILLLIQGKYDECFHFLDSISSITRCEQVCDMVRFRIYTTQKEFEKAEKYYNLSVTAGYVANYNDRLYLAYLYTETGRKKEALTILNNSIKWGEKALQGSNTQWAISSIYVLLAAAYAMLDENSEALKCLSEVERTGPNERYISIKTFPGFDKLRSNPEFQSILKSIEDKKASLREQVKEMELRGEIDL
jgi:tetratricopeptide (TPR) repeat protein